MRLKLYIALLAISVFSLDIFSQEIDIKKNDLLNGKLYQESKSRIEGHPFLIDDRFYTCNITYKGISYNNILLKYDLVNQQIIYFQEIDPKMPRFILLNLDYLDKFELLNNSDKQIFTHVYSDMAGVDSYIKYYQIIYDGEIKYIKGNRKRIKKLNVNNRLDEYVEENYYYLIINNKPYRVKKRRDILELFKNNKKELRAFIRKNNLNIKVWSHDNVIRLLVFCETLIEK